MRKSIICVPPAAILYASLGYTVVGVVSGYCRDTADAGRRDSTTIMYKQL